MFWVNPNVTPDSFQLDFLTQCLFFSPWSRVREYLFLEVERNFSSLQLAAPPHFTQLFTKVGGADWRRFDATLSGWRRYSWMWALSLCRAHKAYQHYANENKFEFLGGWVIKATVPHCRKWACFLSKMKKPHSGLYGKHEAISWLA